MTTGWKLDRAQREQLLERYPPRYAMAVADHVTLRANNCGGMTADPPPPADDATIIGHADDLSGVEAMVVSIAGTTARPDGGTWHITWSLAEQRAARQSNAVIAAGGWTPLDGGPLLLESARW